ncbi:MAG TPA: hypothetical protein VGA58_13740 [bacterium]
MSKGTRSPEESSPGAGSDVNPDAARARRALDRPRHPPASRRHTAAPPPGASVAGAPSPEEIAAVAQAAKDAGAPIARFWNRIARARRWSKMTADDAADLGAASLAIEAKRGVGPSTFFQRFPELLLAGMFLPFIVDAAKTELRRLRTRRETAAEKKPTAAAPAQPAPPPPPTEKRPAYEGKDLG